MNSSSPDSASLADQIEREGVTVHGAWHPAATVQAMIVSALRASQPSPSSAGIGDERQAFEAAWSKRPWIAEEESDKDRAWRWWQVRAAIPDPAQPSAGSGSAMLTARALVERHIFAFGYVPHPDKMKEAIADALSRGVAQAAPSRDKIATIIQSMCADHVYFDSQEYELMGVGKMSYAVADKLLALSSTTRNNRFCKHDDCPYPDCLVEGGICPSQPVTSPICGGKK